MIKPLGILLLSVASVAVASTAFAGNAPPFSFGFGNGNQQQDHAPGKDCFWKKNCGGGGVVAAPEIDPASALSALTLLGGGLLVLRGRTRKK